MRIDYLEGRLSPCRKVDDRVGVRKSPSLEHRHRQMWAEVGKLIHILACCWLNHEVNVDGNPLGMREEPGINLLGPHQLIDHGSSPRQHRPEFTRFGRRQFRNACYMTERLDHE